MAEVTPERLADQMRRIASPQDDLFPRPSAKAVVRGWADRVEALEAERDALATEADALRGAIESVRDENAPKVAVHPWGTSEEYGPDQYPGAYVWASDLLAPLPSRYAEIAAARAKVCEWARALVDDETASAQDAYCAMCTALDDLAALEK